MNALAYVVGNANYDGEHNLLIVQNRETDSRNKFGNDEVEQIPATVSQA